MNRLVRLSILALGIVVLTVLAFRFSNRWPANLAAIGRSHAVLQREPPRNRLLNASFEYTIQIDSEGNERFPPWLGASFWNHFQAQGWRQLVAGQGSPTALELNLTDAPGHPYHIGVEQDCGHFSAGTQVELEADVFIPHDLEGAYAEVQAVLYQSGQNYAAISLRQKKGTAGWIRLSAKGQAPTVTGQYECMLVIHLVAEQALHRTSNIVRFDNVVLREVERPPL